MAGEQNPGTAQHGAVATSDGLAQALAVAGDRWSLQVVAALADGPCRFGELSARVGAIAPNILTSRLRQLEGRGVVAAVPYSRRPLRLAYQLTDAGAELAGPIALLASWGQRHFGPAGHTRDAGPLHSPCGTALETTLYCPTCEQAAEPNTNDEVVWL